MKDFILLMHSDTLAAVTPELWPDYFAKLNEMGVFLGGSAMGGGETTRKQGRPAEMSGHISGFIRIQAENLGAAKALVAGNPVFECGGTVEIRELPRG